MDIVVAIAVAIAIRVRCVARIPAFDLLCCADIAVSCLVSAVPGRSMEGGARSIPLIPPILSLPARLRSIARRYRHRQNPLKTLSLPPTIVSPDPEADEVTGDVRADLLGGLNVAIAGGG